MMIDDEFWSTDLVATNPSDDVWICHLSLYDRPMAKLSIVLQSKCEMDSFAIFLENILWSITSNALLRSKYMTSTLRSFENFIIVNNVGISPRRGLSLFVKLN